MSNYKMTAEDEPYIRGYNQASYGWYPNAGYKETCSEYKALFMKGYNDYIKRGSTNETKT